MNKMIDNRIYVIINSFGKRVKDFNNKVTPAFEYPEQCKKYIEKHLRGSKNITWVRVK